ncbi:hypothetical protein SAMN05660964_01624 [Thiothrix caldifontis]|uniref:Uncharacterized protein n=1 Tax=Thiothrix caldifontis TaxID=525918 RepID=A0A1H4BDY7_9GAMM|nr:hypothetical protein SAMN05660964_01624 [Thiothrix caldifontis]
MQTVTAVLFFNLIMVMDDGRMRVKPFSFKKFNELGQLSCTEKILLKSIYYENNSQYKKFN